MNNKGFTLVELIATIALLAVISIISFVSINAVIDSSKINECNALVNSIKSATKEYVSDNRYNLDEIKIYKMEGSDKKYNFPASVLVDTKKISSQIINPFEDDESINNVTNTTFIEVTLNDNYTVKELTVKNSTTKVICDSKKW